MSTTKQEARGAMVNARPKRKIVKERYGTMFVKGRRPEFFQQGLENAHPLASINREFATGSGDYHNSLQAYGSSTYDPVTRATVCDHRQFAVDVGFDDGYNKNKKSVEEYKANKSKRGSRR